MDCRSRIAFNVNGDYGNVQGTQAQQDAADRRCISFRLERARSL